MSKPPGAPPLYWHQDWAFWDDPVPLRAWSHCNCSIARLHATALRASLPETTMRPDPRCRARGRTRSRSAPSPAWASLRLFRASRVSLLACSGADTARGRTLRLRSSSSRWSTSRDQTRERLPARAPTLGARPHARTAVTTVSLGFEPAISHRHTSIFGPAHETNFETRALKLVSTTGFKRVRSIPRGVSDRVAAAGHPGEPPHARAHPRRPEGAPR